MTEQVDLPEGGEKQEAPQYTDIEIKALDLGWRPKEEFEGDEEAFIDAKEFVRRQPLFDKISQQSREIKEVRKALEALKTHYTTVKESEYERALQTLKNERKAALTDGDGDKFEALDEEIKTTEKQLEAIKEQQNIPVVSEPPQEFVDWKNANRWYSETAYMRNFADEYGLRLAKQGVPPGEVLKQVTAAVKKEFPHKFTNPNKGAAPNVNEGKGSSKSSGSGEAGLTEQERKIMNTLVHSGAITKEKYLADLKAIKERN